MKKYLIIIFTGFICPITFAQGNYWISKPVPSYRNNILSVSYDVTGCGRNEFVNIKMIIVTSKGDTLKPEYITGDLGDMVPCGLSKTIKWDLEKDNVKLSDDIEIYIKGNKANLINQQREKFSRGNIMLTSAFIPGLGQMKATGKPAYLAVTGLFLGSAGAAMLFTLKASDYKQKYNDADDAVRDEMFDKWQKSFNISKNLFYATAAVWAGNMVWSALVPISNGPKKLNLGFIPCNNNLLISAGWNF